MFWRANNALVGMSPPLKVLRSHGFRKATVWSSVVSDRRRRGTFTSFHLLKAALNHCQCLTKHIKAVNDFADVLGRSLRVKWLSHDRISYRHSAKKSIR
jgi:hypothetical protein